MNCRREDVLLYAVTNQTGPGEKSLADQVERALRGGVTMLQLREKTLDEETFLAEAYRIKDLCDRYGVPLIINDNVRIAKKTGAAGVHVGPSDMSVADARAFLGPDRIIGASARTVEQAVDAERQGADYLGVGAVFATDTKQDAIKIERRTLTEIAQTVHIPVAAIGGITAENLPELAGSGIDGVAVVSAIFGQEDEEAAAQELKRLAKETLMHRGGSGSPKR
ncbi:MAG: thiamine phosphate synthase [Lachnospiraceae bacterium]|nr:thiamine phosphate synthase [Lachnospiraceae bacterium]